MHIFTEFWLFSFLIVFHFPLFFPPIETPFLPLNPLPTLVMSFCVHDSLCLIMVAFISVSGLLFTNGSPVTYQQLHNWKK